MSREWLNDWEENTLANKLTEEYMIRLNQPMPPLKNKPLLPPWAWDGEFTLLGKLFARTGGSVTGISFNISPDLYVGNIFKVGSSHISVVLVTSEKVIVLDDDWSMFPSDILITKINILRRG